MTNSQITSNVGQERLLRKKAVLERTGFSNASFYDAIKRGEFKQGVKIGPRAVAWPESEVNAWIESRIAEREAA